MQEPQNLNCTIFNSVNRDIGRSDDNQFSRGRYAARMTRFRMRLEDENLLPNLPGKAKSSSRTIRSDVIELASPVLSRGRALANLHADLR